MSEANPASVLELRQAILNHDTWNESMLELAGFTREGFVAIDGGGVERDQLPAAVQARLGLTEADTDEGSEYHIELGRRINRRYANLSEMYDAWPQNQEWDASYVYDDYGDDTAFIRIGRASANVLLYASYIISAKESFEPGQLPLCDVRVEVEDHMPMRKLIIDLGEKGGSMVDMAKALGIDPMTGERDLDKPEVDSDTSLRVNLATQLGTPLSAEEITDLHQNELVIAEMHAAESDLQPLTNIEILGLAALARTVETSIQI